MSSSLRCLLVLGRGRAPPLKGLLLIGRLQTISTLTAVCGCVNWASQSFGVEAGGVDGRAPGELG